jgi:hypothetical protein
MTGIAPEPPPSEPVVPVGAVGDAAWVWEAELEADGVAESEADAAGLSPADAEAESDGPTD